MSLVALLTDLPPRWLFDCATNTRYDCLSLLTVALPILHCRGLVTGWRINYLAYKAKILLAGWRLLFTAMTRSPLVVVRLARGVV